MTPFGQTTTWRSKQLQGLGNVYINELNVAYSAWGGGETEHTPRSSVTSPFAWHQTAPLARGKSPTLICVSPPGVGVEASNSVRNWNCGSAPWADFPLGMQRDEPVAAKDTNSFECICAAVRTCVPDPAGNPHEGVCEGPGADSPKPSSAMPTEASISDCIGG